MTPSTPERPGSPADRTGSPVDRGSVQFLAPEVEELLTSSLSRLALEQKVRLLSGVDAWGLADEPAVGLRRMVTSDGPAGVRGEVWDECDPSVNIPSATAIAASWDLERVRKLGLLLAAEARRKGVDVLLAPTVNIQRSPYGGRHFECYSEDPALSGDIGTAFVSGVQEGGVAATVKHFVANDSETDRFSVNVRVDERTLREVYLRPFEHIVRDGGAWAVMAAYNSVDGVTMTEHPMLREVLAGEWGFDGVVMSDWLAARTTEGAGNAGLDLAMPDHGTPWGDALVAAVRDGRVSEKAVDEKALRLLRLAARVGAFESVPTTIPRPELPTPADLVEQLRDAAATGFVLTSNVDELLPLDRSQVRRIAVIGPNATPGRTLGGGSATVFPPYTVSPLDGLRAALARFGEENPEHTGIELLHAPGVVPVPKLPVVDRDLITDPETGEPGLTLELLDADGEVVECRHRSSGELYWIAAYLEGRPEGSVASLRIRTRLRAAAGGVHQVGLSSLGRVVIEADGQVLADEVLSPDPDLDLVNQFTSPPMILRPVTLAEGQTAELVLGVHTLNHSTFGAMLRLLVAPPVPDAELELDRAAALAYEADVAVVVVGTSEEVESEGFDRDDLRLPYGQDELVRRVIAANSRTVVVVNSGSPVLLPWASSAGAVLLSWFPGQEFGNALAEVLFGDREPGGRLPTTWPADAEAPLPAVRPTDGELHYDEGLHVGYRRFARDGIAPLYWFGHGLGYTTWRYLGLEAPATCPGGQDLTVTVRLRNTGTRRGREVVQVYAARPDSGIERPKCWLVGFAPVEAEPGEEVRVPVRLGRDAFTHWDVAEHDWAVEPGEFLLVAARSAGRPGVQARIDVRSGDRPD